MTIRLHQFPRAFGLPNASVFCMKVETFLRMARIDYEIVTVMDPSGLPKGKAPAIEHEGRWVADSTFILDYLTERFEVPLDAELGPEQRAIGHAFARMLEERLYWALVYVRWVDPRGWAVVRDGLMGMLPPLTRSFVSSVARRKVRRDLRGHGLSLHAPEEIFDLAGRDLAALAAYLGDKDFFLGESPTTIDAVVHASVANCLVSPPETPLVEAARSHPNLVAYSERMRERYFGDLTPDEMRWSPAGPEWRDVGVT